MKYRNGETTIPPHHGASKPGKPISAEAPSPDSWCSSPLLRASPPKAHPFLRHQDIIQVPLLLTLLESRDPLRHLPAERERACLRSVTDPEGVHRGRVRRSRHPDEPRRPTPVRGQHPTPTKNKTPLNVSGTNSLPWRATTSLPRSQGVAGLVRWSPWPPSLLRRQEDQE